jgi:hypothetical protein
VRDVFNDLVRDDDIKAIRDKWELRPVSLYVCHGVILARLVEINPDDVRVDIPESFPIADTHIENSWGGSNLPFDGFVYQ